KAIQTRLRYNKQISNPTNNNVSLLVKEKDHKQVQSLLDKLDTWLPGLDDLFIKDCDEIKAKQVWGRFFRHEWWGEQVAKSRMMNSKPYSHLNVKVQVTSDNNKVSYYYDPLGKGIIPK